ncbi:hypothetical protein ADN00_05475 [Ornatilinea apprima]|uniref:Carbohydrate kinase PfkB domain-containing protein n=1 Tax=Ornatilinea apprima TaxID=1134406 RepID=A0A0N8GNP8_9CHLR|nr:carbohydrate kinase family protein [Ornatilinea apprima]KPL78698.1 hypothetical protein ADN00_05475 [Ornatilinea apprima]
MIDYLAFTLILDDIAMPDGTLQSSVLGGGGPQTAFGMSLFSQHVGIVSGVGRDLPGEARDWFAAHQIDTQGLAASDWPTLRALQVMSRNGNRQQVWRSAGEAIARQLGWRLEDLPEAYRRARGWHLGIHPDQFDFERLWAIKAAPGRVLSVEAFRPAGRPVSPAELQGLLNCVDIFSVNLQEAYSLVGEGTPEKLCERFMRLGKALFVLRIGDQGSWAANPGTGEIVHAPAVKAPVRHEVGAGNAYCGGFLTGWVEENNLREACARGAVAASFWIEGGPRWTAAPPRTVLESRLEEVKARMVTVG